VILTDRRDGATHSRVDVLAGGERTLLAASRFLSELALDGAIITASLSNGSFGPGGTADRCLPAAAAEMESCAFGEVRIGRQEFRSFSLREAARATRDAPGMNFLSFSYQAVISVVRAVRAQD
jgi:hypothetical protein